MFAFSKPKNSVAETRLFFRGIRFSNDRKINPHEDSLEVFMSNLGYDCDMNILNGSANKLLEINRNYVKIEEFAHLRKSIAKGVESFFETNFTRTTRNSYC